MKKVKLFTFVALFAMGSFALTSCGGEKEAEDAAADTEQTDENAEDGAEGNSSEDEPKKETTSTVMYQCPDNCDEGRAYFDAGTCKKCDKDLVEI